MFRGILRRLGLRWRSPERLTSTLNPVFRPQWRRPRAVVIAQELGAPQVLVHDADPRFDLVSYSYLGKSAEPSYFGALRPLHHVAFMSEFWGESLYKLCVELRGRWGVVCFLNSDVLISVQQLNRLFDIGDLYALDVFQPALSPSSFHSHAHLLATGVEEVRRVPFVEVMLPCLSDRVISEIAHLGLYSQSGWGMDTFLFNHIVNANGLRPPAVVDGIVVHHAKPVSSDDMVFSNGLSAREELEVIRQRTEALRRLSSRVRSSGGAIGEGNG